MSPKPFSRRPSVTHAVSNASGPGLNWRLSNSFGLKTLVVRTLAQLWVLPRCHCSRMS